MEGAVGNNGACPGGFISQIKHILMINMSRCHIWNILPISDLSVFQNQGGDSPAGTQAISVGKII